MIEIDSDLVPQGPNNGPTNALNNDNGPDNSLNNGLANGLANGPAKTLKNANGLTNGSTNGPANGLNNSLNNNNNGLNNGPNDGPFNGLTTSRHTAALQVAQALQAPAKTLTIGEHLVKALLQDLIALVPQNQKAIAQGLAKQALRLYTAPTTPTNASLKKVVIEGIREALIVLPTSLQQPTPLQQSKQAKQAS